MEGVSYDLDIDCPNPVYHWIELIKLELGVDLREATTQDELDEIVRTVFLPNKDLVRNITPDALSSRFARECVNAGYPEGYFSFHALRIGWLCSAIIQALRSGTDTPLPLSRPH